LRQYAIRQVLWLRWYERRQAYVAALAEEATKEHDPDKLRSLVRELTEALDRQTTRLGPPPKTHPSKRLLFVDDEEGIRETLPVLLQQRGFDVRVAASVPEAISEIKTHKFDVLLSDLNIGKDGDGFTVVQAMRRAHPNCVTVLADRISRLRKCLAGDS